MTKVINFFGSPGAGKSTISTKLFAHMKILGEKVELVTEFAKDLIWSNRLDELRLQAYVFGEQLRRQFVLLDKVDYIITDSPILLTAIYNQIHPEFTAPCLGKVALKVFNDFSNVNLRVELDPTKYQTYGRTQSLEQTLDLEFKIKEMLEQNKIGHLVVNRETLIEDIYTYVKS